LRKQLAQHLRSSLPKGQPYTPRGTWINFGEKIFVQHLQYVHNVRLNWVNRESCDLRWRCGSLFTFVGAWRGHLRDSIAFLLVNV